MSYYVLPDYWKAGYAEGDAVEVGANIQNSCIMTASSRFYWIAETDTEETWAVQSDTDETWTVQSNTAETWERVN